MALLAVKIRSIANRFATAIRVDPYVLPYVARVSAWGHWFICLVVLFQFIYRPEFWYPDNVWYWFLNLPMVTLTGLVHYRILTNRSITGSWLLLMLASDFAWVTTGIVIQATFHGFMYLGYYPFLALLVVVFPSLRLGLAWTTMTAVVYILVTLLGPSGFSLDADHEKALLVRLAAMYAIVLFVSLITRFERTTRQAAVERERRLQQERIEHSQEIHDTTAQTAYMIGLGIHRARELADKSNGELMAALDATSTLSQSAMWELRRPIDEGHIFEGRELGSVLWSHCATFERITGISTVMSQSGLEPPLEAETRARLFSIAHNALTNAFLHARPGGVEVKLDFETGNAIRLDISDDGSGLPDDYTDRGRGFIGMRTDAEQMGGMLMIESSDGGGTNIACVVPLEAGEGGR